MTRRGRRRRGRRIQCCIKDNNTLYQNEISTLRRLMLADIHDTPCKTLCRVYSNTMSAPKFYGTERSAPTIPYFLRPNIVFKIRAIIRRVLSLRALLLRKYPILEREGKKKKKKKREEKKIAMKRWSIFNTKLVSTLASPSFSAWSTCLRTIVLFSFRRRTPSELPAKIRRKRGVFFSLTIDRSKQPSDSN